MGHEDVSDDPGADAGQFSEQHYAQQIGGLAESVAVEQWNEQWRPRDQAITIGAETSTPT